MLKKKNMEDQTYGGFGREQKRRGKEKSTQKQEKQILGLITEHMN